MKLKQFTKWFRGLFAKEGTEKRVPDDFALVLNNVDIDITGKIVRRSGYKRWSDLGYDEYAITSVTSDSGKLAINYAGSSIIAANDIVQFRVSGGSLPTGLSASTNYFVITATATKFTIATTLYGTPIVYTDAGSGSLFFQKYFSLTSSDAIPKIDGTTDFANKVQAIHFYRDVAGVEYVFVVCNHKVYCEIFDGAVKRWHLLNPDTSLVTVLETSKRIDVTSYLDTVFFNDYQNNVLMYNAESYDDGFLLNDNFLFYFSVDRLTFVNSSDFSFVETRIIAPDSSSPWGVSFLEKLRLLGYNPNPNVSQGHVQLGECKKLGNYYYVVDGVKNSYDGGAGALIKLDSKLLPVAVCALDFFVYCVVTNYAYYEGYFYVWAGNGHLWKIDPDTMVAVDIAVGTDFASQEGTNDAGSGQTGYSICIDSSGNLYARGTTDVYKYDLAGALTGGLSMSLSNDGTDADFHRIFIREESGVEHLYACSGNDEWKKINLSTTAVSTSSDTLYQIIPISSFNDKLILVNSSTSKQRLSDTWVWADGTDEDDPWYYLFPGREADPGLIYYTNYVPVIFGIINRETTTPQKNYIRYLGSPRSLVPSIEAKAAGSALTADLQIQYYMSYVLLDNTETYLSEASMIIVIPDYGSDPQPVKVVLSSVNLLDENGATMYETDDVQEIRLYRADDSVVSGTIGEPNLLASFTKNGNDEWFTVIDSFAVTSFTDNSGDLLVTKAGHGLLDNDIIRFTVSGSGVLPTGLALDTQYYVVNKTTDTFEISETEGGTSITYSDAGTLPVTCEHVYAEETYEDFAASIDFAPFNYNTVKKYQCRKMLVHKNRLVLIFENSYLNKSVLQYSDVDLAKSIPAENIRTIQSGDGDELFGGVSNGDYLFLFKERKTYAILGDVYDGQLLDIDLSIGTKYKDTVVSFNNVVYFMNDNGIFKIQDLHVVDLGRDRLANFFNKDRVDCMDIANAMYNVFAYVDAYRREIKFFITRKVASASQTTNNYVIIYDTELDFFRTYKYTDTIFTRAFINDVEDTTPKEIMSDYAGIIYELDSAEDNDDDAAITYEIQTKNFYDNVDLIRKIFRIFKLYGKNIPITISIKYYVDGTERTMTKSFRNYGTNESEVVCFLTSNNFSGNITISITGGSLDDEPIEIEEMIIGYDFIGSPLR